MQVLVTGAAGYIGGSVASAASYTMGSTSRVRAVRARRELGWAPHRPPRLDDIEHGSYQETP
jgi:uncharacterized protein YbjT (DUF2867 family)